MHLLRKTRRITMLVGAGAVAAYFLDPDNGPRRRGRILEQVQSVMASTDAATGAPMSQADRDIDAPPVAVSDLGNDAFPPRMESDSDQDLGADTRPIDLETGRPLSETPMVDTGTGRD